MTVNTITTTVLTASKGHYLTDGTIYGKTIYLEQGRKETEFYEMNDAEYEAMLEQERLAEVEQSDEKEG